MARGLSFWKLDNTSENKYENREIYELLSAGEYVENISKLPSDAIRESFKKVFSDWVIEDSNFNNGVLTQVRCETKNVIKRYKFSNQKE